MLRRALPLIDDLLRTRGATLGPDLLAGTITAILLIPQALAYALLAGLPAEVGLYASVLPPLLYAFLGSSRTLAVGPVAVAAVMVSAALIPFADGDPQRYLTGALMLSALTGAFLLLLAVLRLGWLTHFISHPVLSGFTTGAAIFIIGTQLAPLTGITVPREAGFAEILVHLWQGLSEFSSVTALFGGLSVVALILARKPLVDGLARVGMPRAKAAIVGRTAPLILVVVATLVAAFLHLGDAGHLAVVGSIPAGLPGLDFGFLRESGWLGLLPSALMIALIGYVESISVARALAFRRHEKIDPDRELMALGVTNMAGACVGAMPVAGGFARSMVNFEAGARTQAAAIVTAIWVALGAVFFTGLLNDLPKAVLAAIIVVAVYQLIDFGSLLRTWKYDRGDGIAQAATIFGVLALGVEGGLIAGAALGAAFFLYRTSRPHIAVVGRVAGTEHYRNIHRHVVQTWPALLLLRVDENLYFANTPRVEDQLMSRVLERDGLSDVVLILSGVGYIDAGSLEMLESFERSLSEKGIRLHLAEVKGPVMDRLRHTPLLASLGDARVHLSTDAAVEALVAAG
ncbi:SulP family inorganic anion transporter [Panacagrimonas sp.]|uniref:SulP family inorganic anion transporter n=1 Tax=Panacagrimonas sp. TaxID=2480088 RepID=UPI003B5220D7